METQYLVLLNAVLKSPTRETRNGNVHSFFNANISHDMDNGFPLLTSKKMFWKGIVEELAWFLRGCTDVQQLRDKGVHIWDGNSKDRDWDAGPIYGWQWRFWGAEYTDKNTDYRGQGTDQIAQVIRLIKEEPHSRRILLHGWNVNDLHKMCLPPCHVMYQFYVEHDGRLSVKMTQRSADVFLGLPFNIASTALLLSVIAHECDLRPGNVHISIGDVHLYSIHEKAAQTQLERQTHELPRFALTRPKDGAWHLEMEHCNLFNYVYEKRIPAPMVA